jgi:hypothetical protein
VVTRGADLNEWIGKQFEIQGVVFEEHKRRPLCPWMNQAFCQGAEAAMKGRGGLRAKSCPMVSCESTWRKNLPPCCWPEAAQREWEQAKRCSIMVELRSGAFKWRSSFGSSRPAFSPSDRKWNSRPSLGDCS